MRYRILLPKLIAYFFLLLIGIWLWYISIPALIAWLVWETNGRKEIKWMVTGGMIVLSIVLTISSVTSKNQPIENNQLASIPIQQNSQPLTQQTTTVSVAAPVKKNIPSPPVKTDVKSAVKTSAPTDTASSTAQPLTILTPVKTEQPATDLFIVTQIVDGDTIKIDINGRTETIRLIGLDTPEVVDSREPVQCLGVEASNKAKELLAGKKVRIEMDYSQGDRDKYGRLLAYVYREDGLFYDKYMIEQGFAHEYTYNIPYKYQTEFKAAQKLAQENQRGLWSPGACSENVVSSPTSTVPTQTTVVSQPAGNYYTSSYYTSKYYYPAACPGWRGLSSKYLKAFDSLESLLAAYPSRTLSPQCQ